jgi:hypothetical protein
MPKKNLEKKIKEGEDEILIRLESIRTTEELKSINIQTTKVDSWSDYEYLKKHLSKIETSIDLPRIVKDIDFDIRIYKNGKLRLSPGTNLNFKESRMIFCKGEFLAEGENGKHILLTGQRWDGLYIIDSPMVSLKYCDISKARGHELRKGGSTYYEEQYNGRQFRVRDDVYNVRGGGIFACDSKLNILYCQITDNNNSAHQATTGGGGIAVLRSDIQILNNIIKGNSTQYFSGGGILIESSQDCVINNNQIYENKAERGGGISIIESRVSLDNNTIFDNRCEMTGGGIFIKKSDVYGGNNIIRHNTANQGGGLTVCDGSKFIGDNNRADANITTYVGPNKLISVTISKDNNSYTNCIEGNNSIMNH